jgi:hypothetical protein
MPMRQTRRGVEGHFFRNYTCRKRFSARLNRHVKRRKNLMHTHKHLQSHKRLQILVLRTEHRVKFWIWEIGPARSGSWIIRAINARIAFS